jgi:hypothetical protein
MYEKAIIIISYCFLTPPHHTTVHCNPPCRIALHPTTPQIRTTSHHTSCTPQIRTTSRPPHTTPYHTSTPHRKVSRRAACRERHKTGCQHMDTPVQLQVRRRWLSLNVIQKPYPTSCCNLHTVQCVSGLCLLLFVFSSMQRL